MFWWLCISENSSHAIVNDKEEKIVLEYGQSVSTNPNGYLKDIKDSKILSGAKVNFDGAIDNEKGKAYPPIGDYTGKVAYWENKEQHSKKFTLEIKDTKAPIFVDFKDKYEVEKGSKAKFVELFKADDVSAVVIKVNSDKINMGKDGWKL